MRFRLNLNPEERRVIFLSSLGGALEFYDFVIYMFFATTLNQLFFPGKSEIASLMGVFAVFAIGYLIRPLGGIVFGHFGDRYGRKKTFVITVVLMAVPTFLIGFLPTAKSVGLSATFALVLLRILQGLAVGGEIPGAITFAGEHVHPRYRGLTCGIIFFGLNCGIILGSLVSLSLYTYLSPQQLLTWGWRIPFIFGGFLGVISYYLRRYMTETPLFAKLQHQQAVSSMPILIALRYHSVTIIRGMAWTWLGAVIVTLLYLYLPTYLTALLHYDMHSIALLNSGNLILFSFAEIMIAWASDYLGRRNFLTLGAILFIITAYGLFDLLTLNHLAWVMFVMSTFSLISACITGTFPTAIIEAFPTEIRYTGLAIAYNLGFAIFGGLTPLLVTYLIHSTGNILSPSFYLIVSAIACLIATLHWQDRHGKALL